VPTVSANNPLLQSYDLPPFSAIRAEHVQPAIEQILADNRVAIEGILQSQGKNPTWAGLVAGRWTELNDRLGAASEPGQPPQRRVQQRRAARSLRGVPAGIERLLHRDGPEPRAVPSLRSPGQQPGSRRSPTSGRKKPSSNIPCATSASRVSICRQSSKNVTPRCRASFPSWAANSPTNCWTPPRRGPSTSPRKPPSPA